MITIDELKAKLGGMKTAVDDLRDALSIEASEKRLAELEHQMTMPGFYDDQARSQKVISEMGEVKNKLERFGKLSTQYEEAETLLLMIEEENDPSLAAEGEEAVNGVEKSIDELQLMTMLNGEYDHNNAILTFHAGTGGTEAQDWAEMLYRMYTRWAEAHGYSVEVLDVLDGDEAGIKSASMMVKGPNAYGMLKSEHGVHRLVRISPFDANARRQTSFSSLEVMPELDNNINIEINPADIEMQVYRSSGAAASRQSTSVCPAFSSMRLMPLALMRWMTFCSRASEMDSRIKRSFISIFLQFAAGGRLQVGKDEAVQVAVHDSLYVAALVAGAVVLDQRVGHKDVAADLVAPGDLILHALDVVDLVLVLLQSDLVQLGLHHLHGVLAVLQLAALGLAGRHDAGGLVDQADGGGRLVDVLAACAGGPALFGADRTVRSGSGHDLPRAGRTGAQRPGGKARRERQVQCPLPADQRRP